MRYKGMTAFAILLVALAASALTEATVSAEGLIHCPRCRETCPPPYCHYQEKAPCIRFKCRCPKPVCGPCELQHWGYYQPCWRPWPFKRDFSHCPCPPPAAFVPETCGGTPAVGVETPTNPGMVPPPMQVPTQHMPRVMNPN